MPAITAKFGGTSLADAENIRRSISIVQASPERRFVVPSAPGKRHAKDIKVTDLLYTWHSLGRQGLDPSQARDLIADRFRELAHELSLDFDIDHHIRTIEDEGLEYSTPDFMASRGEYLNGLLMAAALGATFVDPAGLIRFDALGGLDPVSYGVLGDALSGEGVFVVPGFYGTRPDGRVKTFSRGGSDVTGAIVARATRSDLYENWTDVSGFLMADPAMVPNAGRIAEVTYQELRELSYMGAKVLHEEAIFPVREPGIPINIRNTREPENPGTMIVASRETHGAVVGIAGVGGFSMIHIEKALMNKERGFGRKVLSVLEEHEVSFEHMPTGIDTISLIMRDEELNDKGVSIMIDLERVCSPDRMAVTTDLAIIATVGQGMVHHVGTAARLTGALAKAGVNIRVINQGSSEINIIIGVEVADLARAVKAIHDEFAEA